jgi:hypothetical protein
MPNASAIRPRPDEYAPYYEPYVKRVPDGSIVETLARQGEETATMFAGLDAERGRFRYAPGKWTVLDVLGHVMDGERVFAYRALRGARGDATPLPGYDENRWAPLAGYSERTPADILAEYRAVRAATIAMLEGFDDASWGRTVTANEQGVSVRALAWIIAGHELHHRAVLAEKYGLGAEAKRS